MPFIVQCPHANCRKYMLLEDEVRGTTVNCLLCTKPIRVDASASGSHGGPPPQTNNPGTAVGPPSPPPKTAPPPVQAPPPRAAPGGSDEKVIVNCPNPMCRSPLKVSASARGTSLRCPKCKQVFKT